MSSTLVTALVNWTQLILGVQYSQPCTQQDYYNAFKNLLIFIDKGFFSQQSLHNARLPSLVSQICTFYDSKLGIPLRPQSIPATNGDLTNSKTCQIFQLIFGIAFRVNHSKYVVDILRLKPEDQEVLMPFVDTLMNNTPAEPVEQELPPPPSSLDTDQGSRQFKRLLQQLDRKEFEMRIVRQRNQELQQGQYELKQRVIVLKDENDKLGQELSQLQSEKTELIIELGFTRYETSYGEVAKRYREQIKFYQNKLQDLENFLESKNSQIEERSSQIESLKQSIGSRKDLEDEKLYHSQETAKLVDKNNQVIEELSRQIDTLNQQISSKNQRLMDVNKDKNTYLEEIKDLKMIILKSERSLAKYQQLKKLYKGFISSIKPHIDV